MSRSLHAPALPRAEAGSPGRRAGPSPFAAPRVLQRKLAVGRDSDPLEAEADRFADRVVAASPSTSSEPAAPGAAPAEVQRFATSPGGTAAVAPPSVDRTLAGTGSPLAAPLRSQMEGRFGCDFSRVRVHAGPAAERSAREVDSLAYTVGHDMVFAPGQFSPATRAGQRLIAHELTHVLQQTGVRPLQGGAKPATGGLLAGQAPPATAQRSVQRDKPPPKGAPSMGTMPAGPVRAATPQERREFAVDAARFLQGQAESFALQPARDIAVVLGLLRSTAENGLSAVAGEPTAADAAEALRTAYRDAVRVVLLSRTKAQPKSVTTPPTLQELYEAHRDEILPFGLPQATADSAAGELSAELTAPLPAKPTAAQRSRHAAIEAARQKLQVLTSGINMPIEDLFSTKGGKTTIGLPANTTARFASTIPAALQRGLQNVAGKLADSALTANTTVMLALDLTPYGGSYDAYRFTRLDLGKLGGEILIERQGAIGVEGLQTQQRQDMRKRFDGLGFQRGSGFKEEEFDQVLLGLGEMPEAQLRALGSLRFERKQADPADPDAAAHYDQAAHTVRVFDRAYADSMTRLGRGGRVLKFAAQSVIHELGHAHDLSSLRTTAAASETAKAALLGEFGTGGGGFTIPDPRAPERARFDVLNRGVTSTATAETSARSLSGARWTTDNPATVTDDLVKGARQPAFRTAALADGGPAGRQMPTNYPHPDSVWQEYFAESFALYQSSPDLLQQMRPKVFLFMKQQFPK